MAVQLLRRQFTVAQYHQMVAAGILTEDDRVELIEGEIIEMSPIGRRHAACVNRLVRLFSERLGDRVIVAAQNPVELSDRSEPQPDVALLQPRSDFYEAGHPQPQDILLLVDLNQNAIAVYREPSLSGYGQVEELQREQILTVQAIADINLVMDEVLG
jgi:Uma2 family endonuclease